MKKTVLWVMSICCGIWSSWAAESADGTISWSGDLSPSDPTSVTSYGSLKVGSTGTGTLTLTNGGTLASSCGYIGYESGSTGTMTVTGAGSFWSNESDYGGYLHVGRYGAGTLTIEDGAQVASDLCYIGYQSGSTGTVTVTGADSVWANAEDLYVGRSGTGTLNIEDDAVVYADDVFVGRYSSESGSLHFASGGQLVANSLLAAGADISGSGTALVHGVVSDLDMVFDGSNQATSVAGSDVQIITTADGSENLGIGCEGIGTLLITNAAQVANVAGYIGYGSGSTGTATVTGAGSVWNNSDDLYVGRYGTGILNVEDGAVVVSDAGYIGYESGSTGSVTVTGAGSVWANADDVYVGRYGTGTLSIEDGAVVYADEVSVGCYSSGSSGSLHFASGGQLAANNLYVAGVDISGSGTAWVHGVVSDLDMVFDGSNQATSVAGSDVQVITIADGSGDLGIGFEGNGTLLITNAAQVASDNGYIGYGSGSTGAATVTGADSAWSNEEELYVGSSGTGTLNIEDGAGLVSSDGYIGSEAGSTGTVTVTGAGSVWTNWGDVYIGQEGTGALNIEDGAVVYADEVYAGLEDSGSGLLHFESGGQLVADSLLVAGADLSGSGTAWVHGVVSDLDMVFDGSNQVTNVAGSDVQIITTADGEGVLGAGYAGVGSLLITNATEVESTSGYIGYQSGSTGTATVTGAGSLWDNSYYLYVGRDGAGTLTIEDGAEVDSFGSYIGYASASTGSVTVTGAGSLWDNSYYLYVGRYGAGTLTIEDGAKVDSSSSYMGYASASTGSVMVTGSGSVWTNANDLYVGWYGTGILKIEDGAQLSNDDGNIGYGSGSMGSVTVTGADSAWDNAGDLYVGRSGTGTLNIEAGAQLINDAGYIGYESGSTGTVTVTGAGSVWTNADDLYVGRSGTGTLNIEDGAVVYADAVYAGSEASGSGSLNFASGGQLVADSLSAAGADISGSGTALVYGVISDLDMVFDGSNQATSVAGSDVQIITTADGSADLGIGYEGNGTLLITNAAQVASDDGYVGYGSGSTGTVMVTGSGSTWANRDDLYVGQYGTGTLNVEDGAVVASDDGYIGYYSDSTGTVSVTGAGSVWTNADDLYVGSSGTGTLNIEDDAVVYADEVSVGRYNSGSGLLHFASGGQLVADSLYAAGSDFSGSGTALVHGVISDLDMVFDGTNQATSVAGSDVQIITTADGSEDLGIGCGGIGTLLITNAAQVASDDGYIGYESGSTGTATVTGAGSTWTNRDDLYVGRHGTGILNVEAAAQVSGDDGYIGYESGSTGTVTVTGAGSVWANADDVYVGRYGTGTLNIEDGAVVYADEVSVGSYSSEGGSLHFVSGGQLVANSLLAAGADISGSGTALVHGVISDLDMVFDGSNQATSVAGSDVQIITTADGSEDLGIGYEGIGTLLITNAAQVASYDGYIGCGPGSTGTATVTGAGSVWTNSDDLYVGQYGTGILNVEDGAVVVSDAGHIGYQSGSTGTVTVTGAGSVWTNADDLYVGRSGTGILNVEAGAQVVSDTGCIGYGSDSMSAVTVTGAGSVWTNTENLYVGRSGTGTLNIEDGAVVVSDAGYIGYEFGSMGLVTVTGAGSVWTNADDLYVGRSGTGTLNIEDGAVVYADAVYAGSEASGSGSLNFASGGQLVADSLLAAGADISGSGTALVHGVVSDLDMVFDGTNQATSVAGSDVQIITTADGSGDLGIGYEGNGTLLITNGAQVASATGYIGYESGSTGIATVTGEGSMWTHANELYVGKEGTGTLAIEAGAQVLSDDGYIGCESGSTGAVTVTGAGSVWTDADYLYVGRSGTGTLDIEAGAQVVSDSAFISYNSGSAGSVTVTGAGSVWTNADYMAIGQSGTGTVNIENGAQLISYDVKMGYGSSSTGTVTVTGSGSTWINSGQMYVGGSGTGVLNIEDGAVVSANEVYVDRYKSDKGTLNFDSGGQFLANTLYMDADVVSGSNGTITTHGIISDLDVVFDGSNRATNTVGSGVQLITVADGLGDLGAGYGENGSLLITNAAQVVSENGYISHGIGATGTVTVTGADSEWRITENLKVGDYSYGSLLIEDGARVTVENAYIGNPFNAGAVTVDGVGSEWAISGGLTVYGSAGSVLKLNKGSVRVGGNASLGANTLIDFTLYNNEVAGLFSVAGALSIDDEAVLGLTTEGLIYGENEYLLIETGSGITGSFGSTNIVSDYEVGLVGTNNNMYARVDGVKVQRASTPEQAQATTTAFNAVGQSVSKACNMTRSMVRNNGGAVPAGPNGPSVLSGDWVGYTRQFNDWGGQEAESGVAGSDWQTHGFMVGLERLLNDRVLVGMAGGGAWTDLDVSENSGGSSEMFISTAYLNYFTDVWYAGGGLLCGRAWNDADRYSTGGEYYEGSYESDYVGGWLEAGYAVWQKAGNSVEPYARVSYMNGQHDGYRDSGGSNPLTVSGNGTDNLLGETGARGTHEWATQQRGVLRAELKAGLQYEFLDRSVAVNTEVLGTTQRSESPAAARAALVLGARLDWSMTDVVELGIGYEPTFAGNWHNHALDVTFKYEF